MTDEDAVNPGKPVSWGRRLSMLAAAHLDKHAVIFAPRDGGDRSITWRELDHWSNRLARRLQELGLDERSMLAIGLPNCLEHYVAAYAGWKLGALVLPLRADLPPIERDGILAVGNPRVVVAEWNGIAFPRVTVADLHTLAAYSDASLPDKLTS